MCGCGEEESVAERRRTSKALVFLLPLGRGNEDQMTTQESFI